MILQVKSELNHVAVYRLIDLGGWQGPVLYGGLIMITAIPPMWGYMVLNVGAGLVEFPESISILLGSRLFVRRMLGTYTVCGRALCSHPSQHWWDHYWL